MTVAYRDRIKTMISNSKVFNDGKHVELQNLLDTSENPSIQVHRSCISTYCSDKTVSRAQQSNKRESDSKECSIGENSTKKLRRSGIPDFNFQTDCIYCGKECPLERDPRHPDRWKHAYQFREVEQSGSNKTLKQKILDICDQRNDEQANLVRLRVNGAASDLHAADARYHVNCRVTFQARNTIAAVTNESSSAQKCIDQAFQSVLAIVNQNRSLIWNSTDLYNLYLENAGTTLSKRGLVAKVAEHFDDEILVLTSPGVANILLFRSKASDTLRIVPDDSDDLSPALSKVKKSICAETKEMPRDKSNYETRLSLSMLEEYSSNTLLELLAKLSPKLDSTLPALLICNIVTSAILNQPTQLQLCIGLMLRDSKETVKMMHDFGVACHYEELRRFRKSVAMAASYRASLSGVYDAQEGLIQFVADNFDQEISSQNGKKSTHSLAMIMTQAEKDVQTDSIQTVPRLSNADMKKPITYDLDVVSYTGPKKPDMPQSAAYFPEIPQDLLAQTKVLQARAKELDLSFLKDIIQNQNCPEFNGFNTQYARQTGLSLQPKTKVTYLPLIDMPPAHHDTILTAMVRAQELSQSAGQNYTILTLDLQLYKLCIDILWHCPEKFPNFYPRLGGMHLLMSFIGSIGTLMECTGLAELLTPVFAGVPKLLSGKKFPQNVRALRIVTEELLRPIITENEIESHADLMKVLEECASKSKTAKLWVDVVVKSTFIAMLYIRSEREADFLLQDSCIDSMRSYFFHANHYNYARYSTVHLITMRSLPEDVLAQFMKGEHVLRHIPGIWNGLWSDMFIETTFMRFGKGKQGILGITLKPEALKTWALSLHVCGTIASDMASLRDRDDTSQEFHKEEGTARIKNDAEDRKGIRNKLSQCINPLDPTQHPDGIVNIVSGKIGPQNVNVHETITLGTIQRDEFDKSLPGAFHEPIEKRAVTMAATKKSMKVAGEKVYDTNLIYSRVIGLQASNREVDIDDVLSHELAPVPTAMFTDGGDMRTPTNKSVLKNKTQEMVSDRSAQGRIDATIIDGSAYLYIPGWPASGTVQEYVNKFKDHMRQKLIKTDVFLVFDRYFEYSPKGVTRISRGTGLTHQLSPSTELPARNVVLNVTDNKKQLIRIICEDLQSDKDFIDTYTQDHTLLITADDIPVEIRKGKVTPRPEIVTNHEEADAIIIQQAFRAVDQGSTGVSVMADDTDIYVMLLHFYNLKNLTIPMFMESPVQGRRIVDIKATARKCNEKATSTLLNILAGHGLSGCDTVAKYQGIGKSKVLDILKSGKYSLSLLGEMDADWSDIMAQATKFILACYGQIRCESITDARVKVWKTRVGRGSSTMPKLCLLPPTESAFQENVKRAHHQVCIWKNALNLETPWNTFDALQYGWSKDEPTRSLVPITVPANTDLAPSYIQEIIKCSCASNTPCSSANCGCNKAGIPCSVFCGCHITDCYRIDQNSESDGEDGDDCQDGEGNDD